VPGDTKHAGVSGKMVTVDAQAGGILAIRPDAQAPDYERGEGIRFRANAPQATKENPLVVEFRAYSKDRRAWFWRKVAVEQPGWQTIDVPLRYCRHSSGAHLDWSEARRYAFYFRQPGNVSLDGIEFVPSTAASPAYLSAEEIGKIGFSDTPRIYRNQHFAVITDQEALNGPQLLGQFEKLYERLYQDFPKLSPPKSPVPCLIFSTEEEFRAFWPRLAERFGSEMSPVKADGFTALGIAGSFYRPSAGSVRPVYIQEACHALLARVWGVANQGEWLHEGLANYYQLQWSGQDINQLTSKSVQEGKFPPLEQIVNGKPIGMDNYAQAVLFTKWLVTDDTRRSQLFQAMLDMRQRCSTELAPIAQQRFGMDLKQLETAWLQWARENSAQ
jgi:hypothetical protein